MTSVAIKVAASRVGVSAEDYEARRAAGLKWCIGCKDWCPARLFGRDRTRGDGLRSTCRKGTPKRARSPRDPMHEAARRAVNYAVRYDRIPRASSVPCTDCGHLGADRRHEYDHFKGYEPEHRLDVEPVCTPCHAEREMRRRNAA